MAVVNVHESWSGDDSSWNATPDGNGNATVSRHFTVAVDGAGDSSVTVLESNLLPAYGDAHPHNSFYRCRGASATRRSPILFDAKFQYTTDTAVPSTSPINEPARVRRITRTETAEIDQDVDGNPIVTANNEPIFGVTKTFYDLTILVQKNIAVFDPLIIYLFGGAVSSSTFHGFPPGTVACVDIQEESVISDGFSYSSASFEFQVRNPYNTTAARAWYSRVRHEGYLVRTDSGEIVPAVDEETQQRVTRPVLLNADGTRLTDTNNAHWLEFPVTHTQDLNALGLGI